MAGRPFASGADQRRHPGGRPPTARSLRASWRRSLGPHAQAFAEQARVLALSGDPLGLLAASILLAVAAEPVRSEPAAEAEHG